MIGFHCDCRCRNGRLGKSSNSLLLGFIGIQIGDTKLVNFAIAKGDLVWSCPGLLDLLIILLCPVWNSFLYAVIETAGWLGYGSQWQSNWTQCDGTHACGKCYQAAHDPQSISLDSPTMYCRQGGVNSLIGSWHIFMKIPSRTTSIWIGIMSYASSSCDQGCLA